MGIFTYFSIKFVIRRIFLQLIPGFKGCKGTGLKGYKYLRNTYTHYIPGTHLPTQTLEFSSDLVHNQMKANSGVLSFPGSPLERNIEKML